jgi:hypothetical protein
MGKKILIVFYTEPHILRQCRVRPARTRTETPL